MDCDLAKDAKDTIGAQWQSSRENVTSEREDNQVRGKDEECHQQRPCGAHPVVLGRRPSFHSFETMRLPFHAHIGPFPPEDRGQNVCRGGGPCAPCHQPCVMLDKQASVSLSVRWASETTVRK
jgi:hypothetical protein